MSENKVSFMTWLAGQKIKLSVPAFIEKFDEVNYYAQTHGICKDVFWKIDDYKKFNFVRTKLSGDKIFKNTQKSLYSFFEKFSKVYADFLKESINDEETSNDAIYEKEHDFYKQNDEYTKIGADDWNEMSFNNSNYGDQLKPSDMPAWDIYESAILLDAYLRVAQGISDRQTEINYVSQKLRTLAENKGMILNDMYRNVNGISIQMNHMKKAYTGIGPTRNPPKKFFEIVEIYNNDNAKYNKILSEANDKCAKMNTETSKSSSLMILYSQLRNLIFDNFEGALPVNSSHSIFELRRCARASGIDLSGYSDVYLNSIIKSLGTVINGELDLYYGVDNKSVDNNIPREGNNTLFERFRTILREHFSDGINYKSIIDLDKFRLYYSDEYSEEYIGSDDDLCNLLLLIGPCVGDRVFVDDESSSDLTTKILNTINETFKNNASCIYVKELYNKFKNDISESYHIYSLDSFNYKIREIIPKEYFIKSNILYSINNVISLHDEIFSYIKSVYKPVSPENIGSELWYISISAIRNTLLNLEKDGVVKLAGNTFIYAENILLDDSYLVTVESIINKMLSDCDDISAKTLREELVENYPAIADNFSGYSEKGFIDILKSLLRGKFHFQGKIISLPSAKRNIVQIFEDFCSSYTTLSIAEIKDFAKSKKIQPHWNTIYKTMIRIDDNIFMRNDQIYFNVEIIDEYLYRIIGEGYSAIKTFNTFQLPVFSSCPWNCYLLESYAYNHSKKYKLIHPWFIEDGGYGAIVYLDSGINDFYTLVLDIFTKALTCSEIDCDTTSAQAITYLSSKSYIKRSANSNEIEQALKVAKSKIKKEL